MKALQFVKIISCGLLCLFLLLLGLSEQSIAATAQSYTYNIWKDAVPGPDVFQTSILVGGIDLGIGEFDQPQDLFVGPDQVIYLLDTGNNRIVCIDQNWNLIKVITEFVKPEQVDRFNNPTGIFVSAAGQIYVADKGNKRIVILDQDGNYLAEIGAPSTDLEEALPENFNYLPTKVVVDRASRIYVIVEGVFDGIMEFDQGGTFKGFLGAPRVAPNMIDYFWRRIGTEEQKKRMSLILPTEYSNFDIDELGFIYATVSGGAIQKEEAVRRLNPGGKDVLRRTGFFLPVGDLDYPHEEANLNATIKGRSVFIDIASQELGIYSVLDQKRGRIFTYDANGQLLYVFGGLGDQHTVFKKPVAIAALGQKLLVLDSAAKRIKVFAPTEYTLFIHQAIEYYHAGNYQKSTEMWREVLKRNTNFDLAYSGIGRSSLMQNKFAQAMTEYRLGNNRQGYSEAFQLYRKGVLIDNFGGIMTGLFGLIILIILFKRFRVISRVKEKYGLRVTQGSYLDSLKYAFYVIIHPFDGFWDLKHEKRGNLKAATTILLLVSLTYILMRQYTGFLFNYANPTQLNIYMEFISILLPFMLWCGINWSVTTLLLGKGTFQDIYITTAYALTPIIIVNIPLTVISNYLALEEGAFYYVALTGAIIWSLLLVFFGTMVTHQYEIKRTLFTSMLTIIGIGIVIFIGLLFFSVIAQLVGFVDSVYTELVYRL